MAGWRKTDGSDRLDPWAEDTICTHAGRSSHLRCVLAFACLLVVLADSDLPREPALACFSAYFLWGLAVAFISRRSGRFVSPQGSAWADIVFFAYAVSVTGGAQSAFFICFLFPIIVISFSRGFREALLAAIVSCASLIAAGLAVDGATVLGEMGEKALLLLVLGYATAYWSERDRRLKHQLGMLHGLNNVQNFRRGADFAIADSLLRLREFFDADDCILAFDAAGSPKLRALHSCRDSLPAGLGGLTPDTMRKVLLGAPHDLAATFLARGNGFSMTFDVRHRLQRGPALPEWSAKVAGLLGAPGFVSVPCIKADGTHGRLFLVSQRRPSSVDMPFLVLFASKLMGLVANIQLVEELISNAARRERSRISLDIHDTTLQSYIGLRMGLEAVAWDAQEDSAVHGSLRELIAMVDLTLADLRAYATDLRATPSGDGALLAAVNEQAARYERFYGVRVRVDIDHAAPPATLAAEVFQIIVEGLANIRKHTKADKAFVRVGREEQALQIQIGNNAGGPRPPAFTPQSILQRARMLGGSVTVALEDGHTLVNVRVPL